MKLFPLPSKDSYFKAFGPENPIIEGFWAVLMLRVSVVFLIGALKRSLKGTLQGTFSR